MKPLLFLSREAPGFAWPTAGAGLNDCTGRFQNANHRRALHPGSRALEECFSFLARLSAIHACMKPNWTCCLRTLRSVFEIFIGVGPHCCRYSATGPVAEPWPKPRL